MTENKRFTWDGDILFDNVEFKEMGNCLEAEDIVDILNQLNDENEQLKHDASVLVQSNKDYRIDNEQLKESLLSTSKELQYGVKKVQRLAKENEQLKEENRKLRLENGKLTHDLFWANKMVEELEGDVE
ncbi:MAG: hypothetical protein IJJ11_07840 [Methanosphaera sp.]|nr:hypothetical protein [Methanobrevibacter sp.]MBQ6444566.1 hypothetical protein [Methanosphaera sp.]